MKRQIATLLTLGLILVATFPATIVSAQDQPPPVPHAFFGSVQVNGQPAPVGASVEARGENVLIDNQGNPFIVTVVGQYGGPARTSKADRARQASGRPADRVLCERCESPVCEARGTVAGQLSLYSGRRHTAESQGGD